MKNYQQIPKRPNQIRYASDLHLEQYHGMPMDKLIVRVMDDTPEDRYPNHLLILAGDISSKPAQLAEFLLYMSERYMHVFCVPGNHEYYGQIRSYQEAEVRQILGDVANVTYTGFETMSLEFDNVTIVGNTLWADGGRHDRELAAVSRSLYEFRGVHDERIIDEAPYTEPVRFTVHTMRADNERFRKEFIEHIKVAHLDKELVCVSHHLPFYQLCHPRFGGEIDGGFACNFRELTDLDRKPNWWIFGHTHDTKHEVLYGIDLVSNPRGYNREFDYQNDGWNSYSPSFLPLP